MPILGGAAFAWQAAPGNAAAPLRAETGAVSGVVVDEESGKPLPGASVYLQGRGIHVGQITDAKGRFLFEQIAPYDQYRLSADRTGYLEILVGGASTDPRTSGRPISVAQGQWLKDVRVAMHRAGSLSGRVLDDRGLPLVGAVVRILAEASVGGHRTLLGGPVTRTDDCGAYRLPLLPAGNYYIQMPSVQESVPSASTLAELSGLPPERLAAAEARGLDSLQTVNDDELNQLVVGRYPIPPRAADGRWLAYPLTFFPSASTLDDAVKISLGPGENRAGVDLRVPAVPCVSVSGALRGPPASYAGLTVRLLALGTEDWTRQRSCHGVGGARGPIHILARSCWGLCRGCAECGDDVRHVQCGA